LSGWKKSATSNTADESEELPIALLNGIDKDECSETLSKLTRRLEGEALAWALGVTHADFHEDIDTLKLMLLAQGAKMTLALPSVSDPIPKARQETANTKRANSTSPQ
jgi:hypothetical protein